MVRTCTPRALLVYVIAAAMIAAWMGPSTAQAQYDNSYVEGEVIIKFVPGTTPSEIAAVVDGLQAVETATLRSINAGVYRIPGLVEDAVQNLYSHPAIQYIEPNYIGSVETVPNDPMFAELWGMENTGQTGGTAGADISAVEAWDISRGSANVLVAVIDTGIDASHPDLADNMWHNPGEIPGNGIDDDANGFIDDVNGWDFVNNDSNPFDDYGHGTHVAGTIGGVGDNGIGVAGVNWDVKVMAVKWIAASGFGDVADAILSVEYTTMMGAHITNNSWRIPAYSLALEEAIAAASEAGVFFVASAGNGSSDTDIVPHYPSNYESANVISVAATDHNDLKASFSNWGLTTVDLGAPGVDTWSTFPGNNYGFASGTSMAAPHVAGTLALMKSMDPNATMEDLKTALFLSVDLVPSMEGRTVTGGRINAYRALLAVAEPDSTPPAPVDDLAVTEVTSGNGLWIQWTATGDDGYEGTAARYDVRYADFFIDEANFETATRALNAPSPSLPGTPEEMIIDDLDPNTTYYVALKVFDEWQNASLLSNVVSATTFPPPQISVFPLVFDEDLLTGASATHPLNIQNDGASDLAFSISISDVTGVAKASPSSLHERYPEAMVSVTSSDYSLYDGGSSSSKPSRAWSLPESLAAPTAGGWDVLIVHAGDVTEIQAALLQFPDIDVVDALDGSVVTPTLDDLMAYDAVILAPNTRWADPVLLGDNLADYVDAGGGVIMTTPSHVSGWEVMGRFLSDGYSPFEIGVGPIGFGALDTFDVSHPIMSGVTAATCDLLATAQLTAGAQWVADWDLGEAFVATQGDHVVGVNVFVAAPGNWTGDIPLILRNAVGWASTIPWLTVVPEEGTVPAGGSMVLDVNFDATGLIGGAYDKIITVNSNDPVQPQVEATAHLDVTGAPDIAVDPPSLDFGDVFLGGTLDLVLTVSNPGTDVLTISSLAVDHPDYSLSHMSLILAAGESQDVTVTYTPFGLGPAPATISLDSDDPDEPLVMVPVSGVGLEPPDIAVSPSSLSEALLTGQTSTQTLTIENTGSSDLTFLIDAANLGGPLEALLENASTRVRPRVSKAGETSSTATSDEPISPRNLQEFTTDPAVLVIQDSSAWGIDMGEFLTTEVGIVPTVISSSMIAATDFTQYDVVVTTGDQSFSYYDEISGNVAQFEAFALQGGVIQYQLATQGSDVQVVGGATLQFGSMEDLNDVVAPDHPIVDGLSAQLDGSAANHNVVTGLPAGALVITQTTQSQEPTTVEYRWGAGLVVATGMTWEFLWNYGYEAGQMMLLASLYSLEQTGVQWLSTDIVEGTVAPHSSLDVQVTFDATGLYGGGYDAELLIGSNDPDEPVVVVPAHLDVTGVPNIAVSDTTLDFGWVYIPAVATRTLTVTNGGTDLLTVTSITSDEADFVPDLAAFDLAPGASQDVSISFAPSRAGVIAGTLTIASNDPLAPAVEVTLLGEGVEPPEIAVSPDSLDARLVLGASTTRVLKIENTGASDLAFDVTTVPRGAAATAGPIILRDDFEDGDFDGWSLGGGGGIREVTSATAADSSQYSYHEYNSSGGHFDGIYREMGPVRPSYISFWVRSGSTSRNDGYFALRDAAGLGVITFHANDISRFSVNPRVGGSTSYLYTANTWYHIEFRDIDFTFKRFNFYVNGDLVLFGVPMKNAGVVQDVYRLDLHNFDFGSEAWWDEIIISSDPFVDWLTAEPTSGTVPPGGAADVVVTFDAEGLDEGAYDADIVVDSNDPVMPSIVVPAHLDVTGMTDVVELAMGHASGAGGATVSVPFRVSKPVPSALGDPSKTAGVDLDVYWDPAIATLLGVSLAPATSDWLMEFNPGVGMVQVSMATVNPIDVPVEGVEFLIFDFQLADVEDFTPLMIVDSRVFDLSQEPITHVTVDGSLTVGCEKGDVIADGEINSADAIRGLLIAMDLIAPTPQELCAADMTLDGAVDVGDIVLILQRAVGITTMVALESEPARVFARAGEGIGDVIFNVENAAGLELTLTYDPSAVSFVSVEAPGSKGLTAANTESAGTLRLGFARETTYDGDIRVKFDVLDPHSTLYLQDAVAFDEAGAKKPVELSTAEFTFGVTGVVSPDRAVTQLMNAVPNPFNPMTELRFTLASPGDARLTVYDVAGRRVREFQMRGLSAGEHRVTWDGRDDGGARVSSGTYLIRFEAAGTTDTGRVMLLK